MQLLLGLHFYNTFGVGGRRVLGNCELLNGLRYGGRQRDWCGVPWLMRPLAVYTDNLI